LPQRLVVNIAGDNDDRHDKDSPAQTIKSNKNLLANFLIRAMISALRGMMTDETSELGQETRHS
jgi:hypothetical protein